MSARIHAAGSSTEVMMVAPVHELRGQIEPTLRRFGVVHAAVFGSTARGEATSTSDLDLLVEFEPGHTLLDLSGLRLELESLLGVGADVVAYRSIHPRLRDRIIREQIQIL
jgi:predicted nucleotidyltransferase